MRSENVRRAGWSTCLDTGTVSGTSASPACRGTYCSGPQAAWPCDTGSPTATRHTCTSRRKDPVQVVLPGSQIASRGNLWTRKHNLHTRQSISLTYWHQLPMYLLVLDLHCVLRHRLATSSCRGHVDPRIGDTALSVAAPRAWNRLPTQLKLLRSIDTFHRQLKHFYSSLQLRRPIRTQGTNWWLPCWCAVGLPVAYMGWVGRNINNCHCLLMTYTFLYLEQRCRNFNTCKLNW